MWSAPKSSLKKSDDSKLEQKNKITINIWLPRVNDETVSAESFLKKYSMGKTNAQKGDRIGHVSIKTPNQYVSWWPNPKKGEQVGIFNRVTSANSTFETDCKSEGGAPDLIISLYSLNIKEINDCFEHIEKTEKYGYVLAGDKATTRLVNSEKGQSCSGLAYEILVAGGLNNLISSHQHVKAQWVVVTPDNLGELLKEAKKYELSAHPESQSFPKAQAEYSPPSLNDSSICLLL